jgi:hypothetical protein
MEVVMFVRSDITNITKIYLGVRKQCYTYTCTHNSLETMCRCRERSSIKVVLFYHSVNMHHNTSLTPM